MFMGYNPTKNPPEAANLVCLRQVLLPLVLWLGNSVFPMVAGPKVYQVFDTFPKKVSIAF